MDQKKIELLNKTAEKFGSIARKVNESSKNRKAHSEEVIDLINKSLDVGEELNEKLELVKNANIVQRNKDNIVANTCNIIEANLNKQFELLKKLEESGTFNTNTLEKIKTKLEELNEAIKEALPTIQKIIKYDNDVILMDNLIIMKKGYQQNSIRTLFNLSNISLEDANKAIDGSSSNLTRGLDLVKRFKNVEQLLKNNKKDKLIDLVEDAGQGWNIAVDVNNSSKSQLEFAEKVNQFTKNLHDDSISIKDIVIEKHNIFEECLQVITILTVILSIKFKKYLDIESIMKEVNYSDKNRELLNNLNILADIACRDIREVTDLNYDMTDCSHLNNELENSTVELTEKEIEFFDAIKFEVEAMTAATAYPIEGSSKNITNGKLMEKKLKELMEN